MRTTWLGALLVLASIGMGCGDAESDTPTDTADASNDEDSSVTEDASVVDASDDQEPGCSDVCGSEAGVGGDLADNGMCEDGREDAVSSACARGTDCTDCGPFQCIGAGGQCSNHGDCCGFEGSGALCVDPDGANGNEPPTCAPSCDAERPCPEGFACRATTTATNLCVAF